MHRLGADGMLLLGFAPPEHGGAVETLVGVADDGAETRPRDGDENFFTKEL